MEWSSLTRAKNKQPVDDTDVQLSISYSSKAVAYMEYNGSTAASLLASGVTVH